MSEPDSELIEALDPTAPPPGASEFGRGVVVCLGKFSEHLWNWQAQVVRDMWSRQQMSEARREQELAEAKRHPFGDAARRVQNVAWRITRGSYEERLSHEIEMWMSGASDHFCDLDLAKAPPALRELAELTLEIGHGFTGRIWTWEDTKRIRELWQQACLEIDALLGVAAPDWGEW